jgi:type II secretory pathway pseudopilin PulG
MRLVSGIRKRNGDTIIEVLLSIAIVGAVITGAYALASRSLAEGVSASEHSQAIKLAESQVEALKSRQRDAGTRPNFWNQFAPQPNPISAATLKSFNNFCLDTTATAMLDAVDPTKAAANWKPQYNGVHNGSFTSDNLNATTPTQSNTYNAVCTDTGNVASAKFFINITLLPNAATTPGYLVKVKWTPAGSGPTSQTQIYYRF